MIMFFLQFMMMHSFIDDFFFILFKIGRDMKYWHLAFLAASQQEVIGAA